ncbi:hypothetical protein V8C86DRAFT_2905668 [Haematococcus lacustris]
MASALVKTQTLVSGRQPASSKSRSRPMVVRAVEDRNLDFSSSRAGAEGYVEKDTAGQANMYPTVMRPYEAGGERDTTSDSAAGTVRIAGIAASLAVVLVWVGISTIGNPGPPVVVDASLKSLSAYKAAFSSELGLSSAAVQPTLVVPPVLLVEESSAPVASPAAEVAEVQSEDVLAPAAISQ